jgi:hypothetical protein
MPLRAKLADASKPGPVQCTSFFLAFFQICPWV